MVVGGIRQVGLYGIVQAPSLKTPDKSVAFVSGGFIHSPGGKLVSLTFHRNVLRCHQFTTWYDSEEVSLPALRIVSDAGPVMREILRSGFRDRSGSAFAGGFCGVPISLYCPQQNFALASRMTYGRCRRLNPKRLLSLFF